MANNKKIQGHKAQSSHKADDRMKKPMQMRDRGPGSAFATALLRSEAQRLKAEAKQPGNLGYKQSIDISSVTHRDHQKKGK